MVSSYTLHCFRNRGFFLQLAALVWIVIVRISVTESVTPVVLRGEVGGNVTFRCPVDKTRRVEFFYFQIGTKFINGYHTKHRDKAIPDTWVNTIIDGNKTHVEMMRLSISHSGVYQCIIKYSDHSTLEIHDVRLDVTANYSTPSVTTSCEGGNPGCYVTCASHGGYPETKMRLNIPESGNSSTQVFKDVNSSQVPSPSTRLFTSSSTTYINCSKGQWKHLSCSVGEVTSHMFSVCEPKSEPQPGNSTLIIIACVVVAVIALGIMVPIVSYMCKRGCFSRTAARPTCITNGNLHETFSLTGNKEGKEAP